MIDQTTRRLAILGLLITLATPVTAKIQEYSLVIDQQVVNLTDNPLKRITINGGIPGPTLEFIRGDEAVIHVTNKMKVNTSVHWHGLLLPGEMDGVPGFNNFSGIRPGDTFTYRFSIRQDGTYWYHAHSMGQEQDGHYGSIIIHPLRQEPTSADRDYVILLSDFHEDESSTILSNLKKASDYYTFTARTLSDFFTDVKEKGVSRALKNTLRWSKMRMMPSDLADIGNYTFLVNGKTSDQNWTGIFQPGERIRLRFINASAMSFYDVRIPGLKMTIISADGQAVEPVSVDEFRFGVAETYDVMVQPQENKAFSIVCEALDRSGFALATLAPRHGMRGVIPKHRQRSLLTMPDTGADHNMMEMGGPSRSDDVAHLHTEIAASTSPDEHQPIMTPATPPMPVESDRVETSTRTGDFDTGVPGSGWARAGTPEGKKALSYRDLRYFGLQKDQRQPDREIIVRLGGNMERYIWTLNGKKYEDSKPFNLEYGERVRLTFVNDTMMAHPMHLHGMYVQLENGQPISKLPNKHTVIIAPGDRYSVLLTADEPGEWAFHCHLLYHMMAGMMNKIVVAKLEQHKMPAETLHPHPNEGPVQPAWSRVDKTQAVTNQAHTQGSHHVL